MNLIYKIFNYGEFAIIKSQVGLNNYKRYQVTFIILTNE